MGKTAFERYIEANSALSKCYEAVSFDKYQALSAQQQNDLCKAERDTVLDMLRTNQVSFASLIKERLDVAK